MQVNQVLRDHKVRGVGKDRWALEENLDHLALEPKETEDSRVSQDDRVPLVLLDLQVQKVPQESRVPQEVLVLLDQRDSRGRRGFQEPKGSEEHLGCREPKETTERGDHVDRQVNPDSLDLKDLQD